MKPRAKKKARAISHGIGSPKAENAAPNVRVLVSTEAPNPNKATAPSGRGCVMIPTMVARKIARSCHAFRETPEGTGRNQIITPVAMEARSGFIAAPCHGCCCGDAGATEAPPAAAEALTLKPGLQGAKTRGDLASLGKALMEVNEPRLLPSPAALSGFGREARRVWIVEEAAFGAEARDLRV